MGRERVHLQLIPNVATDDSDPRAGAYSVVKNGIINKNSNGRIVVRKRPGLSYQSTTGAGSVYGMYMRESGSGFKVTTSKFESINSTTDLSGGAISFSNTPKFIYCAGEVGASGTSGNVLVVVQDEATYGKTYYVNSSNAPTLIRTGIPGSATTKTMHGAAAMDGYGFIIDQYGRVYSSGLDDLTTWASTDFISMNYSLSGLFICHHEQHIVAIGGRSVEFMYNDGKPSGSPLAVRQDIYHSAAPVAYCSNNIGVTAWMDCGLTGTIGIWMLQGLQKVKISTFDIDKIIQRLQFNSGFSSVRMSVMSYAGHDFIFVLLLDSSGNPLTKVYDIQAGAWYEWSWADYTTTAFFPYACGLGNTVANSFYVAMGVGYVFRLQPTTYQDDKTNATSGSIDFSIILPEFRGLSEDSGSIKRASDLTLDAARNSNVSINVSWSDDQQSTWSTARALSLASPARKLNQLGEFRERYWKLASTDNYPIELERLNFTCDEGEM